VKFHKKSQLRENVEYIKLNSDFILNMYERAKKSSGTEKDIIMEQIKLFSQHLDEYIEKPSKISLLKK
jgi:hypothetical protein